MERDIDFLIIGAQKAGSTSLFDYLRQHPDISLPSVKEIPFFVREDVFQRGSEYLAQYFDCVAGTQRVGLAYVHILSFPESAARIKQYNPEMQLIAILRNPIERAYSAYWYARQTGRENLATFEEALQAEAQRRDGRFEDRADFGYTAHGHYYRLLQPFLRTLGRDRLKILLTEDLAQRPQQTIRDVLTWLDVDPEALIDVTERSNQAAMPRSMWLQRTLMTRNTRLKRVYQALMPEALRFEIQRRVTSKIIQKNLTPFRYPSMRRDTRERLAESFAESNRLLSELLGRNLSHWL